MLIVLSLVLLLMRLLFLIGLLMLSQVRLLHLLYLFIVDPGVGASVVGEGIVGVLAFVLFLAEDLDLRSMVAPV